MQKYFLPPQLLLCQSNTVPCVKQPRQLILYQGHLIFVGTPVTLHYPGRRSCYILPFPLSRFLLSCSPHPPVSSCSLTVFILVCPWYSEKLLFWNYKNPNHITEGIPLLVSYLSLVRLRNLTFFKLIFIPLGVRWYDLPCFLITKKDSQNSEIQSNILLLYSNLWSCGGFISFFLFFTLIPTF